VDVKFTLTDACNNSIDKTVRFTIEDTTDPVWVAEPANKTVECNGSGNATELAAWLASFSGNDVCGTANVTHDYDAANFVAACGATGYVDVKFTLTDACNNSIDKTVRFTIEDTTDPVWVAEPANKTVECNGSGNATELAAWLASFSGNDVCGTANVTHDYDAANFVAACGATGYVDVKFTLTDACNNSIDKTVRFTIEDTTDPVWVAEPANKTVECNGSGNATELAAWLASFSGNDVCGTANVTHDYDAANFVAACGATGYVDVKFTLTDACNNSIDKTVRFTIEDTTDPVWVAEPANKTVECNGSGNATELAAWLASFSGNDVCGTANVTHDYDAANFVAACGATGYVDVKFTLTDACNNSIDKTVRFTIEDTTDPVWVAEPANKTVECNGSGNATELAAWLASFSGNDVCGTANVTHDYDAANFVAACGATGYVDVKFTLTDACNNSIDKTVRFTIEDTTDPVWVAEPANKTVECNGSGNATELAAWLASFSGNDVCGTANVTHDYDAANFVAACGATGYVDVKFTLTDACNNSIDKTVRFTIEDTTDPVWVAEPANKTVECNGSGNATELAAWLASFSGNDVCGTANVTHDYDAANFVAACGATGYVDVKFTLTDACNNSIDKTVRFTIEDTTDPVWVAEPANKTVECNGSGNATELAAWLASFSGNDVCGTANVTHDYDAANFVAACGATGYVDVKFTLTDACNNSIDKTVRFTIEDTTDPVWVTSSGALDRTVSCGQFALLDAAQELLPVATDICSDVTLSKTSGVFVSTGVNGAGYYENTWEAKDDCGNTLSTLFTQRITVLGVTIDASASSTPVPLNSAATLKATVSPAIAGVSVTFTVYNEFNVSVFTATELTDGSGLATTTVPAANLPLGVFRVEAVAGSGCATSTAYIPVYDPNAGFVTGGGWLGGGTTIYRNSRSEGRKQPKSKSRWAM
jgi:large repetitive protein